MEKRNSKGQFKKGSHLGDKMSLENRLKISKSYNSKSKLNLTNRIKKGDISYWKGKKFSEAHRLALSKAYKKTFAEGRPAPIGMLGKISPFKGTKRPEFSGENHPRWVSDRTQLKKFNDVAKDRRSYIYKNWRTEILKRDNWKCKIDNKECKGRLEVHHILGFTEHPELRYDINNGITLCQFHHPRKRNDEVNLSPFFQKLVMNVK